MDNLELAMQEECFTFTDNYDNPLIVLFGKDVDKCQFCIGEPWEDKENFSMHYINSYEKLKLWLNEHTIGGYEHYLSLYNSRQE